LLVAMATFLTVRQIAKQREASYRPELVFATAVYEAWSAQNNIHWKCSSLSSESKRENFARITFINIGLGAAKEVAIEWDFDIQKAVTLVNSAAQKALAEGYVENETGSVHFNSKNGGNASHIWTNQKNRNLDYILSNSEGLREKSLELPSAYLSLYASYCAHSMIPKVQSLEEFPALNSMVTYKDIAEKVYSSAFTLKPELAMFAHGNEKTDPYLHFSLSPEKLHRLPSALIATKVLKDAIIEALPFSKLIT
tara:strand:- start:94225 stop:94983 length:759 start_codon:yes stop_codon:yes gene_type:complete